MSAFVVFFHCGFMAFYFLGVILAAVLWINAQTCDV